MTVRQEVVLITGASSGIGTELARQLGKAGYRLILTARRVDRLDALAEALREEGAEVVTAQADLADPHAPSRLLEAVQSAFGRLDVLINNAGYGLPTLYCDADPRSIRDQIEVNLVAPLQLTHALLPYLLKSRGTIINVGSSITVAAIPSFGVYGMTKAALAYWNDCLRRELRGRGVKVCLVEPGPVATEFFEVVEKQAPDGKLPYWLQRPPAFINAKADDTASRIIRLIKRPQRRISMLRRVVWPFRMLGLIVGAFPWLGDVLLTPRPPKAEGGA